MTDFMSDYLLWTKGNEAPYLFHKWGALSALSALVGRRFWTRNGKLWYYPHLYTLFVAEAGARKSTAMDFSKDLINAVGGIRVASTMCSVQAITKEMADEKFIGRKRFHNKVLNLEEEFNQYSIFATEFTSFIGTIAPEAMLDFLTGIFTEKAFDESFKGTGKGMFVGPYITLCGCLTPHTMKGVLKQALIAGGFARRTIFVWGGRGAPVPRPEDTTEQQAAFSRCVAWGREITKHSGELAFDEVSWGHYSKWYIANYNSLPDKRPIFQPYYSSKADLLFKCTVLLHLALHGPENKTLDYSLWEYLDKEFFLPTEVHLERVFEGTGINPEADAAAQVCTMLESMGKPMFRKKVEGMFFAHSMQIKDTLDHLISVGRLVERTLTIGGVGQRVIGTPEVMALVSDVEIATKMGGGTQ